MFFCIMIVLFLFIYYWLPLRAQKVLIKGMCRRTYKTFFARKICDDEKGSASVEASIVLPLFVMLMYTVISIAGCLMAKAAVYEGLHETAAYLAEYSYLYEEAGGAGLSDGGLLQDGITALAADEKLDEFTDNQDLVEQYVSGGMSGLNIVRAELADDDYIYIELEYELSVKVPLFGDMGMSCEEKIRQRAYLGYDRSSDSDSDGEYVFVTDTGGVYHTSRDCYHISLTIIAADETMMADDEYSGLTECRLCAGYKGTGRLYVTAEGDRYHYYLGCSGLKRTVYRVKKDEHPELGACSECGH